MSLTYVLTCAVISLVIFYYFVLRNKFLIKTIIKYKESSLIIDLFGHDLHNCSNLVLKHETLNENLVSVPPKKNVFNIPGPRALPFIGTKWQYSLRYSIPKIHEAYFDLHRRYGDIVLEIANGHPFVHLFSRTDIEKVFRYPSKYPFRPPIEIMTEYRKTRPDRYASFGIINEQGEKWHSLRSNLTNCGLTSPKVLNNFIPTLNDVVDDFIRLIRAKRDEHGVIKNFQQLLNLMGLEALAAIMLDMRLGLLAVEPDPQILKLASAVEQAFIGMRDAFYGNVWWKYFPTPTWRDFVKSEETIYDIISDIVDKSMTKSSDNDQEGNVNAGDENESILRRIMTSELDIREKKSGLIDLLSSGMETLAKSLSILLYHLSKNPSTQEDIFREVQDLSTTELADSSYTKACIQESFRITPTAFTIARLLEENTELSGYELKKGTFVLCHTMIANQQEKNFKDAKKFIPERWILKSDFNNTVPKPQHSPALVCPFGAGRRMCPGKRYTKLELSLLVSKLVKNFEIEYLGDLNAVCDFLLGPREVNIRFTDRVRD